MEKPISEIHRKAHRDSLRLARLARYDGAVHSRMLKTAASARLYFALLRAIGA